MAKTASGRKRLPPVEYKLIHLKNPVQHKKPGSAHLKFYKYRDMVAKIH
jgi:hypothetical protein